MVRETRKKRVELVARWARSGLTANKFAAEARINAGTLQYYKWLIGRDSRGSVTRRPRSKTEVGFVEVRTGVVVPADGSDAGDRIEVVLASGARVMVSSGFDAGAFCRVVDALETRR